MTGTTAIKLLLADVDGTLVTQDKVLTERAIAAVSKLGKPGSCSRSPAAARRWACRC